MRSSFDRTSTTPNKRTKERVLIGLVVVWSTSTPSSTFSVLPRPRPSRPLKSTTVTPLHPSDTLLITVSTVGTVEVKRTLRVGLPLGSYPLSSLGVLKLRFVLLKLSILD